MDLEAIRQHAEVRRMWRVGRIGNPQAWCRYCSVRISGETVADAEAVEHGVGCPVPGAADVEGDLDALLAEVERIRRPAGILPGNPAITLWPGERVGYDPATREVVVYRADMTERLRHPAADR
jgi:hypothetical protein